MTQDHLNIANLRRDYRQSELMEDSLCPHPIDQFKKWFKDALSAEILEPNAMILSTVNAEGQPSARVLLLKDFGENGFSFYTNYGSAKGHQIANNPRVAITFNWLELERQIRIEGIATKIAEGESDAYFYSRPIGSQMGALASQQSTPIANRAMLDSSLTTIETSINEGAELKRPSYWGGYLVVPHLMEFWQGRSNRLHDRIEYKLNPASKLWTFVRLAP